MTPAKSQLMLGNNEGQQLPMLEPIDSIVLLSSGFKAPVSARRKQKMIMEKQRREKKKYFNEQMTKGKITENRMKKFDERSSTNLVERNQDINLDQLDERSSLGDNTSRSDDGGTS